MTEPLLHIYGQVSEHDSVYIVGNKEALTRLKYIIDKALLWLDMESVTENFMASDGEGYNVQIIYNETKWSEDYWQLLGLPYTDSSSQDIRDNAIWPWEKEDKS